MRSFSFSSSPIQSPCKDCQRLRYKPKTIMSKAKGGKQMREIKFRAWSNYEQKYYYNIGLVNDSIYADLGDNYGEEEWQNIGSVFDDDFIIEQYTGLEDKNGFEIYEGDIVEVEEKEYQYNEVTINKYKATVVFREGCFKLVEENGLMDMVYNKADKCKVIGKKEKGERR